MSRNNTKSGGFTLTEILIVAVLVGVIVYVAQIAMRPRVVSRRSTTNACINNLRIIDGAKGQWALEHNKQNTDTPAGSDIQPYMGHGPTGELPACPNDRKNRFDTSYSINNVGTKPVCRIMPTNHILP
jgi:prepilin-type N-terminal cleavage/methylation domain-containing protein